MADALAARVLAIEDPSFRNSISDRDFHDAAMEVWGVMQRLQHRSG